MTRLLVNILMPIAVRVQIMTINVPPSVLRQEGEALIVLTLAYISQKKASFRKDPKSECGETRASDEFDRKGNSAISERRKTVRTSVRTAKYMKSGEIQGLG